LFLYQEFQKSLAVATMLREYNVVIFYKRYYMLWVSKKENCASNSTNIVIQKKGQGMQDKTFYCYRV